MSSTNLRTILMEGGSIGLCTPKTRLFSPERKQTKEQRPAVKFLHSKVRWFAQLSAQTFPSPRKRSGYPRLVTTMVQVEGVANLIVITGQKKTLKKIVPKIKSLQIIKNTVYTDYKLNTCD